MGMMDTACPHCGSHDPKTVWYTGSHPGSYGKGMPKFEDKMYFCRACGIRFTRRVPVME